MERLIKRFIIPLLLSCILIMTAGCNVKNLVLTTDFDRTELMRINGTSTYLPELMLYLTTVQNQYEAIYGEDIWKQTYGNESLEKRVKEKVIAELAQVKVMNLMAVDYGISFSERELADLEACATGYYESLTDTEKEQLGLTYEICLQAYKEYAMARNVYDFVIKDVNPEISDDEARTVTVLQIFIKTYSEGTKGERIGYSDRALKEAYEKAALVLELAGEKDVSFESIQAKYNESDEAVLTFGRGDVLQELEEVAFNLSKDEVSDIVETADGYYVFKCISDFEIEATQKNKEVLLTKQKEKVFEETYNSYLLSITKSLNQTLFDEVKMLHDPEIKTSDFFERID